MVLQIKVHDGRAVRWAQVEVLLLDEPDQQRRPKAVGKPPIQRVVHQPVDAQEAISGDGKGHGSLELVVGIVICLSLVHHFGHRDVCAGGGGGERRDHSAQRVRIDPSPNFWVFRDGRRGILAIRIIHLHKDARQQAGGIVPAIALIGDIDAIASMVDPNRRVAVAFPRQARSVVGTRHDPVVRPPQDIRVRVPERLRGLELLQRLRGAGGIARRHRRVVRVLHLLDLGRKLE